MSDRYASQRDDRRRHEIRRAQALKQRRDPKTGRFVAERHRRPQGEAERRTAERERTAERGRTAKRETTGRETAKREQQEQREPKRYEGGGRQSQTTGQPRRDPYTGRFVSASQQTNSKTGRYVPGEQLASQPQQGQEQSTRRYGKRGRERDHRRHRP